MADLAALVVRLEADASAYLKALDQATKALNKFHKDQESALSAIGDKLKSFGEGVIAAFAVHAMVDFAEQAIESAAQLEKMSQTTGIGVQALAGLDLAFTAAGLGADDVGVALKKLNVSISEGAANATSKAGAAFRTMGISLKDANGNVKDAATVNAEVADYFAKTADGANKVALAVALYGKAGQAMIPILDGGAKGLAEFQKQAEAWGLTISEGAARAAEDFERKIKSLSAELKGSFGAQLTSDLLPVLNSLVESFTAGGTAGEALGEIASALTFIFKVVASAVIVVVGAFKAWIEAINGIVHAYEDLVSLKWGKIGGDLGDGFTKAGATIDHSVDAIRSMYDGLNEIQVTAKKIAATDAGSLYGTQEADKAIAKLKAFSDGLRTQALTFKLGDEALVKYDLTVGKYAEDVKAAGKEGQALAASALAAAKQIQFEKAKVEVDKLRESLQQTIAALDQSDVAAFKYKITSGETAKQLNLMADGGAKARAELTALNNVIIDDKDKKAITALNDEIEKTKGHFQDAGVAAFNLQNAALIKNVNERGDTGQQAAIAERRDQLAFIDAYNEQVAKATQLEKGLADAEGEIAVQRAQGNITDQQALQKTEALRKQEIIDLGGVLAAEQKIASDSGIPELTTKTLEFSHAIDQLKTQTDILEKSVRDNLEASFAHNFEDLIDGAKSFRDALKGFLKDIEKMFLDQISKNYAQQLFGTGGAAGGAPGFLSGLLGGGSGGSGGGASGLAGIAKAFGFGGGGAATSGAGAAASSGVGEDALSSLAGLGFAAGGTIPTGSFGLVGENGPEFAYSGNRDLHIQPISKSDSKQIHVHNNFTVQSQNGTISRQSQTQTAALAARSLQTAAARNNR